MIKPAALAAALSLAAATAGAQQETIEPVPPAEPVAVEREAGSLLGIVAPVALLVLVAAVLIADG